MAAASDLKRGICFRYKGDILRVTRKELVAYGTHSHTKLKLFVQNVFGSGEKIINMMHHDKVDILEVIKKSAQVIALLPDKVQVMDTQSYETFDAIADKELLEQLTEGNEVIYVDLDGQVKIIEKTNRKQ